MLPTETPLLTGYLIIPQQSGFSLKGISKKKSSNVKYCLLFKASNHGIQRLEICDKTDHRNQNIITLENCVKITQEQAPANLIHIVTKSETITLNTLNEDDLHVWVTQLQSVAFKDKVDHHSSGGACSVASGSSGATAAAAAAKHSSAIEEDNDLYYYTTHPEGIFIVHLNTTETTTTKVHLEKKLYILQLTATELQLRNIDEQSANNNASSSSRTENNNSDKIIVTWPYRFIRKYGYRDTKFTFEAGRKCETGEGNFSLENDKPQDIFRCMSSRMKSMRKLISGDSLASLDCGEHQLSAALSMEAGSRNPLPPSPGSGSSTHQIHNHSSHSLHGFLSSNDSLNNMSMSSGPLSSMLSSLTSTNISTTSSTAPFLGNVHIGNKSTHHQIIPNKPPRKSLMNNSSNTINDEPNSNNNNNNKFNKFSNYEPIATISTTKQLKSPNAIDANKTLINELTKPNSLNINDNEEHPPELPIRNESKICPDDKYEYVELKTEAWKTLGINEVKHIEAVTPDDDFNEFAWQRLQSNKDSALDSRDKLYHAKFIDINDSVGVGIGGGSGDGNHPNNSDYCDNNNNNNNNLDKNQTENNEFDNAENYYDENDDGCAEDNEDEDDDDDIDDHDGDKMIYNDPNSETNFTDHNRGKKLNGYDKLDFFGSRGKPSNDYKTIVTIQSPGYKKQTSQPVTSNDYEIIGSPDTQSCRMADDSFLGYGMLRKTANSQILLPISTIQQAQPQQPQQQQQQQQNHKYTSIVPSIGLTTSSSSTVALPTSTSNTLSIHSSNNINSPVSGITTNNIVTHQKINGLDYAYVVSKPKRV